MTSEDFSFSNLANFFNESFDLLFKTVNGDVLLRYVCVIFLYLDEYCFPALHWLPICSNSLLYLCFHLGKLRLVHDVI